MLKLLLVVVVFIIFWMGVGWNICWLFVWVMIIFCGLFLMIIMDVLVFRYWFVDVVGVVFLKWVSLFLKDGIIRL